MAGRVEMQPLFTRRMNGLLGNLAGDKGINTEARGAVDKALPAPGAPGNAFYQVRARIAAPQRATPQARFNPRGQLQSGNRHRQLAPRHQRLDFAHYGYPQQLRKLNVVAQFRVCVQRQVVTVQVDVICQQRFQAVALHAANNR